MYVKHKFGHHNGKRFFQAGEIMECEEKVAHSLKRQGLAEIVKNPACPEEVEQELLCIEQYTQQEENVQKTT